jgi:hypothetical protein
MSDETTQKSMICKLSGKFCEPTLCAYWKRGILVTADGQAIPNLPIGLCTA